MNDTVLKLIIRMFLYSFIGVWFWFAVPALWEHGSSIALEFLFGFSLFIIVGYFYIESVLTKQPKSQSK